MDWLEVTVQVPDAWIEAAAGQCLEAAAGVWIEDGTPAKVRCYVPIDSSIVERLDMWRLAMEQDGVYGISVWGEVVNDKEWKDAYKRFFRPLAVGNRFLIIPPWLQSVSEHREVICIDPGLAFGTGHHATTAMVIEEMERVFVGGERVLDGGTGSGILAIVAVMLGAESVRAVDVDPLAVDCARVNGEQYDGIEVTAGDIAEIEVAVGYDVVVTNLTTDLLLSLVGGMKRLVSRGGRWIMSGIAADRVDEVEQRLCECGWSVAHGDSRDGWAMISAEWE